MVPVSLESAEVSLGATAVGTIATARELAEHRCGFAVHSRGFP